MKEEKPSSLAWIGLGSNLGDREKWIEMALDSLRKREGLSIVQVSRLIETLPQGGPSQPNFLNGVAQVSTDLSPEELLAFLLEVEARLERNREVSWGPRTIDLDLLFYGQRVIDTAFLRVPHPRIQERYFVLKPLVELDPKWIHPELGLSLGEIWECFLASSTPGGEGWEVQCAV